MNKNYIILFYSCQYQKLPNLSIKKDHYPPMQLRSSGGLVTAGEKIFSKASIFPSQLLKNGLIPGKARGQTRKPPTTLFISPLHADFLSHPPHNSYSLIRRNLLIHRRHLLHSSILLDWIH